MKNYAFYVKVIILLCVGGGYAFAEPYVSDSASQNKNIAMGRNMYLRVMPFVLRSGAKDSGSYAGHSLPL